MQEKNILYVRPVFCEMVCIDIVNGMTRYLIRFHSL